MDGSVLPYLLRRQKGCEALIIHFCFPCPISGLFFVLLPLIDRGRGFQRGSEHLGTGGEEGRRSEWEIEDFALSLGDFVLEK